MIIIYWNGYPVCATRIDSLKKYNYEVKVFSKKPDVPFKSFQNQIFPPIYLEKEEDPFDYLKNQVNKLDLLIITGWNHKSWLAVSKKLKRKGVKTVMMVDNNLRYSLKQIVGSIIFRLFYSKFADYYLVSGIKSRQLLEFFGVPSSKIYYGFYGYSEEYFPNKSSNNKYEVNREKAFVFVGRKIHRKGIDILIKAYLNYLSKGGDWQLKIIGSGNYKIPKVENIIQYDFMQPKDVAKLYQKNYVFILPSRLEHWGTVVAEAAASGMILLLSKRVGSHPDLLMPGINGFLFDINNEMELVNLFFKIQNFDQNQLEIMSRKSKEIASKFSEDSFAIAINSILNS